MNSVNGSLASQESGANAVEIVKGSRLKAKNMVDSAIKVSFVGVCVLIRFIFFAVRRCIFILKQFCISDNV